MLPGAAELIKSVSEGHQAEFEVGKTKSQTNKITQSLPFFNRNETCILLSRFHPLSPDKSVDVRR